MKLYRPGETVSREAVTEFGMMTGMTRGTQCLEIIPIITPPVRQLHLVVDNGGRRQRAVMLTHLAQRMGGDEGRTDPFPRTAVVFVTLAVTTMAVVVCSLCLRMLRAVAGVYQAWASLMGAWFLGSIGHRHSSVQM